MTKNTYNSNVRNVKRILIADKKNKQRNKALR